VVAACHMAGFPNGYYLIYYIISKWEEECYPSERSITIYDKVLIVSVTAYPPFKVEC
jgi:hypothetical protein